MPDYSQYKRLELPKSNEKYDVVGVVNKNNMIIDSELHKLDLKNQNQDNLLATKDSLDQEISRAINEENMLSKKLDNEIERSKSVDNETNNKLNDLEQFVYENLTNQKTIIFSNTEPESVAENEIVMVYESDT